MLLRDRIPRAFEPDLEARFVSHYASVLTNARTLDGSLAVVLVGFTGWVALVAPAAVTSALLILVGSAIVVLCAMAWLHSRPASPATYRLSTWISAAAVVGAIIAIHVLIRCEVGLLIAATSVTAGGYAMLQLRLREGLALNLAVAAAVVAAIVAEGRSSIDVGSAITFGALGLFANLLAGSYLESTVRRLFMLELASTEEAKRDALTGVLNRRAIQAGASGVHRDLLANPVAVVIADLDHFKDVNDKCGHDTGDRALRACVDAWHDLLRGDDLLARIGGEEFLMILPGTPSTGAQALADRLRRAVGEISIERLSIPLSASFGVADWARDEPLEEAFQRADAALYRAKDAGRNRVELAA